MDIIDITNNKVLFSAHTPGTAYETWERLQNVDFSGIGIPDVSTREGKAALRRIPTGAYVIEDMIARWKTEEELYDLERERAAKLRQLQIRVLEVVRDRATAQVGATWSNVLDSISGDQVAVFGALVGLLPVLGKTVEIDDIVSQYVTLKAKIEAATTKAELDAVVIP